jgi:hypothetical protein
VLTVSLVVLMLVTALTANRVGRWWSTAVPLALGGALALLLTASGHGLADSPIPFLTVASTLAAVIGVALSRRSAHSMP